MFSKQTPDLLWGIARCLWALGGLPQTLVWDRQAGIHARDGRPTDEFAALCGPLKVGWRFCEPADPQAKGAVERVQGFLETNFEPGRVFANERDYRLQLDAWFAKANARTHKTLRERPIDRLQTEREAMAALPEFPDLDRRWVTRIPADPYLRFDTNDYSLDPAFAGRRVDVRISQGRHPFRGWNTQSTLAGCRTYQNWLAQANTDRAMGTGTSSRSSSVRVQRSSDVLVVLLRMAMSASIASSAAASGSGSRWTWASRRPP